MMQLGICSQCIARFDPNQCIVHRVIYHRSNAQTGSLDSFYRQLKSTGVITLNYPATADDQIVHPCYKIVEPGEYVKEYVFSKEIHELMQKY